jgi:hypothetical protein
MWIYIHRAGAKSIGPISPKWTPRWTNLSKVNPVLDQSLQSEPRAGPISPKWTPRWTHISKVNPALDHSLQSEPHAGLISPKWTPRWTILSKVNPALDQYLQSEPRAGIIYSRLFKFTTTHCMFYREQFGPVPPTGL